MTPTSSPQKAIFLPKLMLHTPAHPKSPNRTPRINQPPVTGPPGTAARWPLLLPEVSTGTRLQSSLHLPTTFLLCQEIQLPQK